VAPELGAAAVAAQTPAESVAEVLARFDGRRDDAAAYLGISRTTLWRRMREGR
jgi:propionate catabolism operon transcriptional regulator